MQLTTIEYDAIMKAIDDAKNAIAEDTFIPDYDVDDSQGYTNDSLLEALKSVEDKIISSNTPF